MTTTGTMSDKEKADYFDKITGILCEVSQMPLKEKEKLLKEIPPDFKRDNDLLIYMYRYWNEIREPLIESGYLGVIEIDKQITIDELKENGDESNKSRI